MVPRGGGGGGRGEQESNEEEPLPWPMLGALLFVYVNNQWSRSLIYYLVSFGAGASGDEFMNVGLGFDQTQYSILASFGFTALFAVSSLLAGRVTDRNDRALLTAGSCLVWGLATVATAFAPSFAFVFLFRVVPGCSPTPSPKRRAPRPTASTPAASTSGEGSPPSRLCS
jgi:MFS family permease